MEYLSIAVYPFFANSEWVQQVLQEAWSAVHPAIPLRFIEWDCYSEPPPSDADLFEYDPMFLSSFAQSGFCEKLGREDIVAPDDILPFALRGAVDGGQLWALPHFASACLLFYRPGDTAIAQARTFAELCRIIGTPSSDAPQPPQGQGLLSDYSSKLGATIHYLLATYACGAPADAMQCGEPLQDLALHTNRETVAMSGLAQALLVAREGTRMRWFAEGSGRAYTDFSERPYYLDPGRAAALAVRSVPPVAGPTPQRWFVTMLSLARGLDATKRGLALELANLYTSTECMLDSLFVQEYGVSRPQYQVPVRRSALNSARLQEEESFYPQLLRAFDGPKVVSRMGPDCRAWWLLAQEQVQRAITGC